jgi:hypothetical protein
LAPKVKYSAFRASSRFASTEGHALRLGEMTQPNGGYGIPPQLARGQQSPVARDDRSGCRCYGLELDPLYVDTIIRRWQRLTKLDAIHVESGETFNSRDTGEKPINYERRRNAR